MLTPAAMLCRVAYADCARPPSGMPCIITNTHDAYMTLICNATLQPKHAVEIVAKKGTAAQRRKKSRFFTRDSECCV